MTLRDSHADTEEDLCDITGRVARFYDEDPLRAGSPFCVLGRLTPEGEHLLLGLAPILSGRTILDVGCGLGLVSEFVLQLGARSVVGVDLSGTVLRWSHKRMSHRVQANAQHLPLSAASVDVVICLEVLEHVPDPRQALLQFGRVLRPHGWLLLSTPNYLNPAGLFKWLMEGLRLYRRNTWAPFNAWMPQPYERFTTWVQVKSQLVESGFEVVRMSGVELFDALFPWLVKLEPIYRSRPIRMMSRAVDYFARWPLGRALALHTVFLAKRCTTYRMGRSDNQSHLDHG